MKAIIPLLTIALSLCVALPASANLIFTFSDDGAGGTDIVVSGDVATAAGSGGAAEREEIGFSITGAGSVRQTGFSQRQDDNFPLLGAFASLGSGFLSDTITLTSAGINNSAVNDPTPVSTVVIDSFVFTSNDFYPLVMDGLANNGDTLSLAGSPDTTGKLAVDYSTFATLHGQSFAAANDQWTFTFAAPIPEPSTLALLGAGGAMLLGVRRRKAGARG